MKVQSWKILGVILSTVLATTAVSVEPTQLCKGFLPENDMKIPVGMFRTMADGAEGGLTEEQFNEVIDKVERIYRPEIERAGETLQVNRLWDDNTVNASAQMYSKNRILNMYGGLARHPKVTREGFALVICHEMGHHLGGAPKIGQRYNSWATNEGGSDYFATLKCLRRFFADEDNATIIQGKNIDDFTKQQCQSQFVNEFDQLLCMRNSLSGKSVAYLFMDLRKEKKMPQYNTPDPSKVTRMDDNHPATQCRMDTYFAGITCVASVNEKVDNKDYKVGTCYYPRDTQGNRPNCWFAPTN